MTHAHQEDDEIKWFESATPHFHKVITLAMLQSQKLAIPKKFARKYGSLLSDHVFLKVPDGKTWQVDLDRSNEHDNMVWISRGWSDFVKYYAIDLNFFTVFRCEGNSNFSVMIFDTSRLEIDYPNANDADDEFLSPNIEDEEEEDDDDFYVESSPAGKMKAADKIAKAKQPMKLNQERKASKPVKGMSGQSSNQECKMPWIRMHRHPTTESSPSARALEAASRFNSTCPIFQVVFSEVKMKGSLYLPKYFLENLEERRAKLVTLQVSNRSWRVNLWWRRLETSAFKEARLCAGWKAFRSQVPLHDGDVCIFELVNQKDMLFCVSIFRGDTLIR